MLPTTSSTCRTDRGRTHTANKCKDYIASNEVVLIDNWPAHTPRLSPIEKLWAHLDKDIADLGPVKTVDELTARVRTAWDSIPLGVINRFVMSFQPGLTECVRAKGNY